MSNKDRYWQKTRNLLWVTLAIWFVFSIGIFLFGTQMEASSRQLIGQKRRDKMGRKSRKKLCLPKKGIRNKGA